jgi:hypothetical protein
MSKSKIVSCKASGELQKLQTSERSSVIEVGYEPTRIDYKELLEQEKASDEYEGRKWVDISGWY